MRSFIFVSVICINLAWSYGAPEGVGAYVYQDSAGNRYGGTYGLNNGQYFGQREPDFPIPFAQNNYQNNFQSNFQDLDDFFPEYFRNFENLLQESPFSNFLGFNSFPTFGGFDMSGFPNSAFAGGAAGPGFTHQIASINPVNPEIPNVNVMNRFAEVQPQPGNNFVSMSSRAYSVSSNVNGKEFKDRGAETTVNNNGKVTTYRVKS
ncbi:uncharacterized protein ACR2FA_009949 isoform 2-T2 [Aphomia sociella]